MASDLSAAKAALRAQALAARGQGGDQAALDRHLREALAPHSGRVLAGYWPMRGEPDPLPALRAHGGPLCLPVVPGRAVPLVFRLWKGEALDPGPLGTSQPPNSLPAVTPAASSISVVASPSQVSSVGPQACQAGAASCHWARVVSLYWAGSNVMVIGSSSSSVPDPHPDGARKRLAPARTRRAMRAIGSGGAA